MHRLLRAVFVWVMVIAIPVQGMAASAMLFCGASHQRMAHAMLRDASPAAASHAAHGHDHAAMGHGAHPAAAQAAAPADAGGSADLSSFQGPSSCSACAACCLALALPASLLTLAPMSPDHPAWMAMVAAVVSHQPDGLDRPPRTAQG